MTFFSDVIRLAINNPVVYRIVLHIFGKIELKRDLCLKINDLVMFSNTPDRFIASLLWKFSLLERYETSLLKNTVKEGMHVVDIGANIGYYTLMMSRLAGLDGRVTAFEPDPGNYRLLSRNINDNRISNVTVVQKAISSQSGSARLFLNRGHRGDHRIFDRGGKRPFLEIKTTTLDDYLAGNAVDVIKMDIQGAELMALRGMQKTADLNPGLVIFTEFSPYHLAKCGASPVELLDTISSAGFYLKMIDEKLETIRSISKAALLSRCEGRKYENLFLSRTL